MGNVPTKVDHDVSSFESGGHKGTGRTTPSIAASSRNFTPLVGFSPSGSSYSNSRASSRLLGTPASTNHHQGGLNSSVAKETSYTRAGSTFANISKSLSKKKSRKEREKEKENHAKSLIVRYDETVDCGFLGPFGSYSLDKLDYDVDIVKGLIIARKLAPFYTPLQDYDESWSREELLKIVDGLPLHATFNDNVEEFEGIPIGDLNRPDFEYLIDKGLTKKEYRRMYSKIFKARLYKRRSLLQEMENENFLEAKLAAREGKLKNKLLPSDDLKYDTYSDGMECPICFLYYPNPFNYSVCCQQPICTECFVQIRRAEPQFAHDEASPTQPAAAEAEKDPNLLVSEPAKCPYCATPHFAITYKPPATRRTGIKGIFPSLYKSEKPESSDNGERIDSNPSPNSDIQQDIVTSDTIRPNWKTKLDKERSRLAKRAANATAIHLSNQLVVPSRSDTNVASAARGVSNTRPRAATVGNTPNFDESGGDTPEDAELVLRELENDMLQEAIRLSLQEEERRKDNRAKR